MSTFLKFPSLTNHYRAKFIRKALDNNPGLLNEKYIVTEKLHGANLQIYFEPGEPMRVGSRNRWLDENSKFFNVWEALARVVIVLTDAQRWSTQMGKTLRLFGELHGGNIQPHIDYGPEQNVRFFAAMIDDVLISPEELFRCMPIQGLQQNFVPILAMSQSWQEAMDFDINQPSMLTPAEHKGPNFIEGVVIQPYSNVYYATTESWFALKKKNHRFLVSQKKVKVDTQWESTVVALRAEFRALITETRIDSIISQNGPFTSPQQIGEYIRLILNDAKEEFLRYRISAAGGLDKKTLKYIFNVGGLIANMLKARL